MFWSSLFLTKFPWLIFFICLRSFSKGNSSASTDADRRFSPTEEPGFSWWSRSLFYAFCIQRRRSLMPLNFRIVMLSGEFDFFKSRVQTPWAPVFLFVQLFLSCTSIELRSGSKGLLNCIGGEGVIGILTLLIGKRLLHYFYARLLTVEHVSKNKPVAR